MVELRDLGFSEGLIMETIVSTFNAAGEPNAAPMGITLQSEKKLVIKPYLSTITYQNLLTEKCAVINLTTNPELFYVTAFKEVAPEGKLPKALFGKAKSVNAPKLLTADSTVEATVENLTVKQEERAEAECTAKLVQTSKKIPQAYCRASAATIEAILHATRVKVFLKQGAEKRDETLDLLERIRTCKDVVERVAAQSRYSDIISDLTRRIEVWRQENESLR